MSSVKLEKILNRFRINCKVQAVKYGIHRSRRLPSSIRLRRPRSEREPLDIESSTGNTSVKFFEGDCTELLTSIQTTNEPITEEKALIIRAFTLAVQAAKRSPLDFPVWGQLLPEKSMSTASLVMNLHLQKQSNVDHVVIATSLIIEQICEGRIPLDLVRFEVSEDVFSLAKDVTEIRKTVESNDIIDDITAETCQKIIFNHFDKRAILLEFLSRLDSLHHIHLVPYDAQVPLALDCLYIHVAIGRLLHLSTLSDEMEEICMRILFPTSFKEHKNRYNISLLQSQGVFPIIVDKLQKRINEDELLRTLVRKVEVKNRVKSTSSFMRKLLSLSNLSKGGRRTEEVFDVFGVRAIVWPSDEIANEAHGHKACYLIQDIANDLWPQMSSRNKDYIKYPKQNGYQSLHSTHVVRIDDLSEYNDIDDDCVFDALPDMSADREPGTIIGNSPIHTMPDGPLVIDNPAETDNMALEDLVSDADDNCGLHSFLNEEITFELQIRTKKMDIHAESGASSHAHYKSKFGETSPP